MAERRMQYVTRPMLVLMCVLASGCGGAGDTELLPETQAETASAQEPRTAPEPVLIGGVTVTNSTPATVVRKALARHARDARGSVAAEERALRVLRRFSADSRPEIRQGVALGLLWMNLVDDRVLSLALAMREDTDSQVVGSVAVLLGRDYPGRPETLDVIMSLARSDDRERRRDGLNAALILRRGAQPLRGDLLDLVESGDRDDVIDAVSVLVHLAAGDPEVDASIIRCLRNENSFVVKMTLRALAHAGHDGRGTSILRAIEARSLDEDPEIRELARDVLSE